MAASTQQSCTGLPRSTAAPAQGKKARPARPCFANREPLPAPFSIALPLTLNIYLRNVRFFTGSSAMIATAASTRCQRHLRPATDWGRRKRAFAGPQARCTRPVPGHLPRPDCTSL
jgi:hypothetical protein